MEPTNTTPENNLNTPPVGPMPEPLPPEPTPPAPVVPEPPEPEPAPAPTTPPSLETLTPTPENLNQKPATPEKPKKQGNPNTSNYIIAGVSVGVIAIIIVLICGAIFGGWFGGFAGGPISGFIFGTSQSSSSDVGSYNAITEKVIKRTSDADSINRKAIVALDNALLMYQTNNRGQLPEIDGDSEYVSEYSDAETPVEKFYANYLDDENFVDEFGNKPIVWFYNSYDDFISDYDDEEDLNYMTEITVIYGAACTPDGLEESTGPRAFAINIGNTDFSGHYCVDSGN